MSGGTENSTKNNSGGSRFSSDVVDVDGNEALSKNESQNNPQEGDSENDIQESLLKYEAKIHELSDLLARALADTENLRKRHARELDETMQFAGSKLLGELSVPFEHLFMAMQIEVPAEMRENALVQSLRSGVEMTRKEFEKVFEKHGLRRIDPMGEKFDHNLHQAISQVDGNGQVAGTIIAVVQAGYVLNGRILKPAMVVVAK